MAGVIVVFTLAGLLNRVRQHQAAELAEERDVLRDPAVGLYSYVMNNLIETQTRQNVGALLLLIAAATFVVTLFCRPIFG